LKEGKNWMSLLLSWCKKADTSWDPARENKKAHFLQRDTIWVCVQWQNMFSSWASISASHKSQVKEEVEFQDAVSKRQQDSKITSSAMSQQMDWQCTFSQRLGWIGGVLHGTHHLSIDKARNA
jgi:hypothetical protein